MGILDKTYAQNWVEQMRTNQERLHPERDMRERMRYVDRRGVDVFVWWRTYEGDGIWRKRYETLWSEGFGLIR